MAGLTLKAKLGSSDVWAEAGGEARRRAAPTAKAASIQIGLRARATDARANADGPLVAMRGKLNLVGINILSP